MQQRVTAAMAWPKDTTQVGEYNVQSRTSSLSSINNSKTRLNLQSIMKEAPILNTNSSALKSTSDILNLHAGGSNVYGRNRGRINNLDTSYRVEKCNSLN